LREGITLGSLVGMVDGLTLGFLVGMVDGLTLGPRLILGMAEGKELGSLLGRDVGNKEGTMEGNSVLSNIFCSSVTLVLKC